MSSVLQSWKKFVTGACVCQLEGWVRKKYLLGYYEVESAIYIHLVLIVL